MSSLGENDFWRGAFIKHHGTGSHGEHIVPVGVRNSSDELAEEYNDNIENEVPYEDLKRLGNGDTPYLFSVMIAGGGSMTYDYIVNLDDTTRNKYQDAVSMYKIPSGNLPSRGFSPDILAGLTLIIADQLGVDPDDLEEKDRPPFSTKVVLEAVSEVYEDEYEEE